MKHLQLEQSMIEALNKQLPATEAKKYEIRYFYFKNKLNDQVLEWIRTAEGSLTDHGPKHIENLLDNVYRLISPELSKVANGETNSCLSGIDIYLLATTVLFHDVGNIFGRDKHNLTIMQIMNDIFLSDFQDIHKREKNLIFRAAKAHTGKGDDLTADTLKDIQRLEQLNGHQVALQDIAAIVRFADELAEGPQRTSSYAQHIKLFAPSSEIYHRYASTLDVHIDPKNERISLAYEIEVSTDANCQISMEQEEKLKLFLNYIYERIHKLDAERKYCSFYCDLLKPIRKTVANFSFVNNGFPVDFKIEPLTLNDLVIPKKFLSKAEEIASPHGREDLNAERLITQLKLHLAKS
ncbi:HD domain-containing protein [Pseudomonas sp. EA_15y_Pfl1_P104]|uniref:HD domain-containing protein n=1 Tax=Pseudomonas sp. EA_15y_Pfl1_P104 TaxID=3088686 RepID=UPI0030D8C2E8